MLKLSRSLVVIVLFSLFSVSSVLASNNVVKRVTVIGNESIPTQTIMYYISVKPGKVFKKSNASNDIRRLYHLGYFENISVDVKQSKDGLIVTYFLKEKPTITDIVFKGNKKISTGKIRKALGLSKAKPFGKPLSYKYLDDLKGKILSLYESKGYPNADVSYGIDRISPTRAVATFSIVEGGKANVCRIIVRGNRKLSSKAIKSVLATKAKSILHLRFSAPLSAENLTKDVENIKDLYYENGYLDAVIGKPTVERKGKCYDVIYTIKHEGKRYRFGKISFVGNSLFSGKALLKPIKGLRTGRIYNQKLVNELITDSIKRYGELGFIFADIKPDTSLDIRKHLANVTFYVYEGQRARVRNINILGNIATRDRTVRRDLDLYETGIFNTLKLQRSVRRLFNTGYFENVNVKPKVVDKNKVDVDVKLAERLTGMFSVGAGYSSVSKIVGMLSVSKGNLFGTGDSGSFSTQFGSKVLYFNLNYNHQWWLDKPQTLSFSLYNTRNEYFTYTSHRIGFSSTVTRRIWDDWDIGGGYLFERDKITDIGNDTPDIVKDERGTSNIGMVTAFIDRDLRDNKFLPHYGNYFSIKGQLADKLFAGDDNFYKVIGDYAYYYNLNNIPMDFNLPLIASFHSRIGYADTLGNTNNIPIDYRFYVGGDNSVRGFRWGEAGPKDKSGDPEGANRELIFNFELGYDVTKMLRLISFVDVGGGWWNHFRIGRMRKSAGVGIRVLTPMGPIRLDLGYKLDRKTGEGSSEWHFGMGSYF